MKKKSLSAKKKIHKKLIKYLKNPRINKIYKDFEKSLIVNNNKLNNFSVALSGGPDSLALSYLAKCYSILNNSKVFFFHVDHKIRAKSTNEAIKLKFNLEKIDIKCQILTWKGKKPKSNVQAIARKNRYKLIFNQILKNNTRNILVAHHLNDLYENFIIRLTRGSGLNGLVSFNKKITNFNNKALIIRPLIQQDKKNLLFIANKVFEGFIDDPSNKNTIFKRVRIRNLLKNLKKEGLNEKKLKQTIINLSDSDNSIKYYIRRNLQLNSNYLKSISGHILSQDFFDQPHEIVFRSFSIILLKTSGRYYPSRGKRVNYFLDQIHSKKFQKGTLSGCIIEKVNKSVIIYKENS